MGSKEAGAWDSEEKTWEKHVAEQFTRLPSWLVGFDRVTVKTTEVILVLIGAIFTLFIAFDVVSRYAFSYSSFFTSAAAKFLLLWFFLLGAGLALRQGGHVGFEMLVNSLGLRTARIIRILVQCLSMVFFVQMLWSGIASLGPAMTQTDPSLNISLVWSFLAVPVGFALMIYHMLVLMVLDRHPAKGAEGAK
jgi:TRAP-type C4-dicarboxylate transport system permease small subunit